MKARLRAEVAHIQASRPDIVIIALADGAPDNWTFLESHSPTEQTIDYWHSCQHLAAASDHARNPRWFETYREILRHDPDGVEKVIRALLYLHDTAPRAGKAQVERELAFFGKNENACATTR